MVTRVDVVGVSISVQSEVSDDYREEDPERPEQPTKCFTTMNLLEGGRNNL